MSFTIKKLRARIQELETELAQALIELELEKALSAALVDQVQQLVASELRRRNHQDRENFQWFE